MGWFNKLFGGPKRLSDYEASDSKKKKRHVHWVKPDNAIGKNQMTTEQRIAATDSEAFFKKSCERKGWNVIDFEGPYLIPPDTDYLEYFETLRKERGKDSTYKNWIFEFGNENGFLRGVGDNEGRFNFIIDAYKG